jgi:hypothetical protein
MKGSFSARACSHSFRGSKMPPPRPKYRAMPLPQKFNRIPRGKWSSSVIAALVDHAHRCSSKSWKSASCTEPMELYMAVLPKTQAFNPLGWLLLNFSSEPPAKQRTSYWNLHLDNAFTCFLGQIHPEGLPDLPSTYLFTRLFVF